MDFAFTLEYFMFVLSVTLTSLLMIILGGWVTRRLQKGGLRFGFANKSTWRKKIIGFILFIVGIFLLGWLSSQLQGALFDYLNKNVATSITGIIAAVLVAYFMYHWIVWRKNKD